MGYSRSTAGDWDNYVGATVRTKATVDQIYTSKKLDDSLSPKGINRESRDSDVSPLSTPVIVALDVTGSMSPVLDAMARHGLEKMAVEIYDRKPITDPHIMCMGVGDAFCDSVPLQVTQFESDIRLVDQLTKIYLEGGGGGNDSEGYILPWYFAAMHTNHDAYEKRGKKGFLFTVGDDGATPYITREHIRNLFGDESKFDKLTAEQVLKLVSEKYHVFHLIVEQGNNFGWGGRGEKERVVNQWRGLLGERAILLSDHTKMGEVITSTLQAFAGVAQAEILNSWDASTAIVVKKAIENMTISPNGVHLF